MNGWKFDKKVSVSTALSYFLLSCCGSYFKSFILKAKIVLDALVGLIGNQV